MTQAQHHKTDEAAPIAVVGGGASGLMAAYAASKAQPGPVLLLEKEARVGRKLLSTGNGRCNLLNLTVHQTCYHGSGAGIAQALLSQIGPYQLVDVFEAMGLHTRQEAEGRVYPYSGHAGSVLDALRAACARQGVRTLCGMEITRIKRDADGFTLFSADGQTVRAGRVILSTGGLAGLPHGQAGYRLPEPFGHTVTKLMPALSPLKLPADRIRGLKGVRVQCRMTLYAGGDALRTEKGEALFTEYGLSGIAAMQLSRGAGEALSGGHYVTLSIRLLERQEAEQQVTHRAELYAGEPMERFFTGLLHPRVSLCLLGEAGFSPQSSWDAQKAGALANLLCDWRLPVQGVLPLHKAQVTAGGIPLSEFDPHTLASRKAPGLYACGELLDVDGDCGGYNLLWAWVSGLVAGSAAAGVSSI